MAVDCESVGFIWAVLHELTIAKAMRDAASPHEQAPRNVSVMRGVTENGREQAVPREIGVRAVGHQLIHLSAAPTVAPRGGREDAPQT
jgi:hypothetical protein